MWKKLPITGLLLFIIYSIPSLTQAALSQEKIAAGSYFDSKLGKNLPLLGINSKDEEWYYPTSIVTSRPDAETGDYYRISNTSCTKQFCVAVGSYNYAGKSKSLLAVSKDNGITWNYISTMPKNFDEAELNQVNCNESFCIAVGEGRHENSSQLPFLLISSVDGSTWSFPTISGFPKNFQAGKFNTVTCHDSTCIAAGVFTDNKHFFPLVAVSPDKGNSWFFSNDIISKTPIIPLSLNPFHVKKISCNQNTCLIGGYYSKENNQTEPFLAVSNDRGFTWNFPQSIFSNMPKQMHSADITSVSCNSNECVVAGEANVDRSIASFARAPFLAVSKDRGITWDYPESVISHLPKNIAMGWFSEVSCKSKFCLAGGYYVAEGVEKPLIAVSYDHGTNWSYIENLPGKYSTRIYSLSCNDDRCMAMGSYKNDESDKFYPFLMLSIDKNIRWSVPDSITSNLPANFKKGEFFHGVFN